MACSATTVDTFANKLEAKFKAKLEKAKGKLHKLRLSNGTKKAVIDPAGPKNNILVEELNIEDDFKLNSMAVVEPQIKAAMDPKAKSIAKSADANNNVVEPNNTKDQGQLIISEPKHAGDERKLDPDSYGCNAIEKAKTKAARRAEKKQARNEKWSTRRATLKAKAKKIGEALFFPALVIGGVIFAPVILAISIVFFVLKMVVVLVLHILDLVFCCPVLTCYIASDL